MKIICLHQSADLYGSDRSLLQVITFLKSSKRFTKITVIVPREGPLCEELRKLDVDVIIMALSLLSKTYLKQFKWGKILFPLFNFIKKIRLFNSYDILYVNTSVILDFYLMAPFVRSKKIIHIREIPVPWLSKVLTSFMRISNPLVIFNSRSTQASFGKLKKSIVIHNAFEGFPALSGKLIRRTSESPLKILLIGRINFWKGQDFVIEALSKISDQSFILKIVGSTSCGNEELLTYLKKDVSFYDLEEKVVFEDFVDDPSEFYKWADVIVVPSRKPEPFGRIAIEAMSLGRPVIAANHGGLPEIINDSCGILFEPNDINLFNKAITTYINDESLLLKHGKNAKVRFEEEFSLNGFYKSLSDAFQLE
jgi:glycosyltransferase involved in cell wall biosynthesis